MVRWLQLEANPEVLGEYAKALLSEDRGDNNAGLCNENGSPVTFVDVISTERDVLEAIYGRDWLRDGRGIIMVAPIAALEGAYRKVQPSADTHGDYLFIKQYIDNACGAIAMLHLLGNTVVEGDGEEWRRKVSTRGIGASSNLAIRHLCALNSAEERGRWLESSESMAALHGRHCLQGDTEAPALEAETDLHFVALLRDAHNLVILDGRLERPMIVDYSSGSDFWDAALSFMSLVFRGADNCCALALSMTRGRAQEVTSVEASSLLDQE